jgi:transcriptional regulator with XRE-family HTH domain
MRTPFRQPRKMKAGGRPNQERPNTVDLQVGARIRLRRNMLGFSQETLGDAAGLTRPQIQKYECGENCISASRLHQLSQMLDVPISFFFEDSDLVRAPPASLDAQADGNAAPLRRQGVAGLVRNECNRTDERDRRLTELVEANCREIERRRKVEWALRQLLAVVDLADMGSIDDDHHQAAKAAARAAIKPPSEN